MFGQACFPGVVDCGEGMGAELVEVLDSGVVVLVAGLLVVVGAAAAPEMPAAAPPTASAPATIVAPRVLDTCIRWTPRMEGLRVVIHLACEG